MDEIMPVLTRKQMAEILQDFYDNRAIDGLNVRADEVKLVEVQRDADRKWMWKSLLAHKEYLRKYKGQLQIMFGFSPDELASLKEAIDE